MYETLIKIIISLSQQYIYIKSFFEMILKVNILYDLKNLTWDITFDLIYILFFIIIIISSINVLMSKNPIHSVFFLILVFLHIGFFLLMLHVEFIAFLLFIVYLGAIAVLFLFVIMMFNIHILESRDNIIRYLPMVIVLLLVISEMCYITETINLNLEKVLLNELFFLHKNWISVFFSKDNIIVLSIIYNYYFYNFLLAGLILLIAMIGAIVLTLNQSLDIKKQLYYKQNSKNLYNSLVLKKANNVRLEPWEFLLKTKTKRDYTKRK